MLALTVALAAAGLAPGQGKKAEFKLSDEEKAVVAATNAERKKAGLAELKVNEKLFAAARAHAANMAKQDKLEHTLDDKTAADRITAAGYAYRRTGENIAQGQTSAKDAVDSWMNSEGHKANLLHEDYADLGVGMAKNAKGEYYWVQVFGTPR